MQAEDKVNIFNINDGGKLLHLLQTIYDFVSKPKYLTMFGSVRSRFNCKSSPVGIPEIIRPKVRLLS